MNFRLNTVSKSIFKWYKSHFQAIIVSKNNNYLLRSECFLIWAKPSYFLFIFGLFLNTMTNRVQNLTIKGGVLGIRTWDLRAVGANETTEHQK